jgi:predicted DCC family thiol-disulfide oxidoreductase YuxK
MQAKQSIVVDPKSPSSIDSPCGLNLFDGVCVLCSRGCGFVSKRDRRGYLRFVPMQLAGGRPLAEQLGINLDRRIPLRSWRTAGALMAAFSPQERANYFRGNASK